MGRAAAVAALAMGGTALVAPMAHASSIGPIFLYRKHARPGNCDGNREIKNYGDVNIPRDIYAYGPRHSSVNGAFGVVWRKEYSATRADKQEWCYDTSFYNQYYAANEYSRTVYDYYVCSSLGCVPTGVQKATPWKLIFK
jgi:hypothetical protein